jgi:G3E family GTPase
MSSKASSVDQETHQNSISDTDKVPITLLSGFLGSGKTSTLQHLLENTQGLQIGVIVNDMASVNIDAKLVSAAGNSNSGILELQNGCACCSLADELLTTVDTLLESRGKSAKNENKRPFDAVVIELSGVADPVAIRSNWNAAKTQGHPATRKADVQQIVTLVDASTFGTDWMSWDQAGDRDNWVDPADECAASRKVPELLAEQVEAADVLLINKIDLAGPEQVKIASALARSINDKAVMEEVEFGRVSPQQVLQSKKKLESSTCVDPDCTDPSHSHSHSHEHAVDQGKMSCSDPDCTDPNHPHAHSHDHDSDEAMACSDPDCSDPTHDHEHSHSHAKTDVENLGITNFVYRASRPFNAKKLLPLLSTWPVPEKDDLDLDLLKEAAGEGYTVEGKTESYSTARPFVGVLRSKGFCWLAPTRWTGPGADTYRHDTAMYWSHAGRHFGIEAAGKWWGTLSKQQMKTYFKDDLAEYERILREDFVTEEFGDRRQELVFIGVGINKKDITEALDSCLVSEKGMKRYRQELSNYMNTILSAPAGGAGLFDVGRVDHMDV